MSCWDPRFPKPQVARSSRAGRTTRDQSDSTASISGIIAARVGATGIFGRASARVVVAIDGRGVVTKADGARVRVRAHHVAEHPTVPDDSVNGAPAGGRVSPADDVVIGVRNAGVVLVPDADRVAGYACMRASASGENRVAAHDGPGVRGRDVDPEPGVSVGGDALDDVVLASGSHEYPHVEPAYVPVSDGHVGVAVDVYAIRPGGGPRRPSTELEVVQVEDDEVRIHGDGVAARDGGGQVAVEAVMALGRDRVRQRRNVRVA